MAVDLKSIASKLVQKIQKDPSLITSFTKDPLKTVKKLVTEELSADELQTVVKTVASKITADKAGDLLKSILK
ncbi:MAG: hypothetical protein VB021_09985 [Oscillospiraceae bacterium]|nr:hypothetical protein [Oscillospiraceae bacterium]